MKLDAVTFPSVATTDHGINICMTPDKADQFFVPFEAWMVRLDENIPKRENSCTGSTS